MIPADRHSLIGHVKAVPSSAARSPTSTTFANADDAPAGVKNDNSDDRTPDQEADGINNNGDDARLP
jgi:hypothetical protein